VRRGYRSYDERKDVNRSCAEANLSIASLQISDDLPSFVCLETVFLDQSLIDFAYRAVQCHVVHRVNVSASPKSVPNAAEAIDKVVVVLFQFTVISDNDVASVLNAIWDIFVV
jgi:hypothetical protein